MRCLKSRATYMEWYTDFLEYVTPPANVNVHSVDIVVDMHIPGRGKEATRILINP